MESGEMKSKGGRPKGSKSTDSIEFEMQIKALEFSTGEAMVKGVELALKQFKIHRDKEIKGRYSPMESQAAKYLEIYVKAVEQIACRLYAKLSSIQANVSGNQGGAIQITVSDFTVKEKKSET